jgi:Ran GTPase-activating protein (RanGAP) involved in mRNA processing and transport
MYDNVKGDIKKMRSLIKEIKLIAIIAFIMPNYNLLKATETLSFFENLKEEKDTKITFFKVIHRRHQNFATENITFDLSGQDFIENIKILENPSYSFDFKEQNVTPEQISRLSQSNIAITNLNLSENPFGKEGAKYLSSFKHLESLNLKACALYDEGIEPLSNLVNLKSLSINYNAISPKGIIHLSLLQNLEILDVGSNYLGNDGVKSLADHLPNLRSIDLSMNDIDDQAIPSIISMTNLESINISDNNMTSEGIKKITQNMSKTKIINETSIDY